MKHRHANPTTRFVLLVVICGVSVATTTPGAAAGATTRSQAVAMVREILNRNTSSCHIDRIQTISAVQSAGVWRVTARFVMSASGTPLNEKGVWNVRLSDGKVAAANQLAAEIENGCPSSSHCKDPHHLFVNQTL